MNIDRLKIQRQRLYIFSEHRWVDDTEGESNDGGNRADDSKGNVNSNVDNWDGDIRTACTSIASHNSMVVVTTLCHSTHTEVTFQRRHHF